MKHPTRAQSDEGTGSAVLEDVGDGVGGDGFREPGFKLVDGGLHDAVAKRLFDGKATEL